MNRPLAVIAILALAGLPLAAEAPAQPSGNAALVEQFVAAFNDRNLTRIAELADDSLEWLSVSGSKIAVETAGEPALLESLKSYFASCPTCSSKVEIFAVRGPFVSTVERATWKRGDQLMSQDSFAIYEIREQRILRVWYYPAVRP